MTSDRPVFIAAEQIGQVSYATAREALEQLLKSGFDPSNDQPRMVVPAGDGELLVMPSSAGGAGVKLVSVAPNNPARGLPRIQGWYVLFDADTLAPAVLLDGVALTLLRTAAVSQLAFQHLLRQATEPLSAVTVFGSGPQAMAHLAALAELRAFERVHVAGRDAAKAESFAEQVAAKFDCAASALPESASDANARASAIGESAVLICATSAGEPLFEADWVSDGTLLVAIGSHEPDRRELPAALLGRSTVVVEDIDTALREAGDVVMAIDEGQLSQADLVPIAEVVSGDCQFDPSRSHIFKTVGMSWQDLTVARVFAE